MGWIIGGIVVLWVLAHNRHKAACPAPVTGGNAPQRIQNCAPLYVSPSQALVCHVTNIGCPSLQVPSTSSEGSVAGGQPVNPLLVVQASQCQGNTGQVPMIQPGRISPANPAPCLTDLPAIHCDHISLGPITVNGAPGTEPIIAQPPIMEPVITMIPSAQQQTSACGSKVIFTGVHTCGDKFKIVQQANGDTVTINC